jgi:hypothetical protein
MTQPIRSLLALSIVLAYGVGWTLAQGQAATAPMTEAHDHAEEHDHDDEHGHDDEHHDEHDHGDEHHDDDGHGHGHDELEGLRLLVASLDGPELIVVDVAHGAVIGRFTVPGLGRAYQLPNPQLAAIVHRDAHRVTFVHSGLTAIDHGDHMDLVEGSPYVLATVNLGPLPSHVFALGNDIAVYADGDGSMTWLDARLLGISLDVRTVDGRAAGHGSLAVVDGHLIGGGLQEAAVRVYDRDLRLVATFEGCPGLHGQAATSSAVAFGCSDGVLLVEAHGNGEFTAHKLGHPVGSPEGVRVGTLAAHEQSDLMVGSFGQGIVVIDPAARSLTVVALPAGPAGMRFVEEGAVLVVLTLDGQLHAIDPATGAVEASVTVIEPWVQGAPRPSFTHLGDVAFVVEPDHAVVWIVDLHAFGVVGHLDLPFRPGSVAVLAIPGAATH